VILAPIFLWRAAARHPVGDIWPYRGGTRADILDHLRHAADVLTQGPLLEGEVDFDMLLDESIRSGLVYCTKRDGGPKSAKHGIAIFLSSVAPLAAFCPITIARSERGFARTFDGPRAGEWPPGDWEAESRWLAVQLEALSFIVPSREDLAATLPDAEEIPPVLRGQTQFAAIFF
jgi:hypothetical protein